MARFGTNFNPSAVMMGRGSGTTSPYLWTGTGSAPPAPTAPPKSQMVPAGQFSAGGPTPTGGTLAPETIRTTGTGPFDPAYRQNLASYAGGQFSRPGGSMNFNPTDPSTFPGQPTGGGNAPVTGMPSSLMDMALGGQGFSWTPPPVAQTSQNPGDFQTLQQWMNQFLINGRNGRMGSIV